MTELPDDVIEEAERLTRLAREAVDQDEATAYREDRERLLADHDYTARVREDDTGEVLVCHPAEWIDDGVIRPERVDDVDRGVERQLSGPGDPDEWSDVAEANEAVAEAVTDDHGEVHGATASALAEFMSNHYAKRIADATAAELTEFKAEYFPRNAWPTDEQRALLDESIELTVEKSGTRVPEP
jgi:hypothetical protein